MFNRSRTISLFSILTLFACGPTAQEPEEAIAPAEAGAGDEIPSEPPPPPPPAYLRLVHASPDPAASNLQLSSDGEPLISDLTLHTGSTYAELAPGAHMLSITPTGAEASATLTFAESPELTSGAHYTAIVHGLTSGAPPIGLAIAMERNQPPAEGRANVRVFHAIAGVDALDLCVAGASPRDPAIVLYPGVEYGAFGASESGDYAELPAEGELALQLRTRHATPCRGRLLGVARTALSAGENHMLVLLGRTTGRPRVERELVICAEAQGGSCIAMPITSR